MRPLVHVLVFLTVCFLSGCSEQAQQAGKYHPQVEKQREQVVHLMAGLNEIAPAGNMTFYFGDEGTKVWLFEPKFDLNDKEGLDHRLQKMDQYLRKEGNFKGSYRIVFGEQPKDHSSFSEAKEIIGYDMEASQAL